MKINMVFVFIFVFFLGISCIPITEHPTTPSLSFSQPASGTATPSPTQTYNSDPCFITDYAWSPDGSVFAMGCRYGGIYLYDPITWKEVKFIKTSGRTETNSVQNLAFSPDGKTILYTLWSQIWQYDLVSGKHNILTKDKYIWEIGSWGNKIVFAPDGQTFALRSLSHPENGVITPSYGLSIWNMAGEKKITLASDLPNAEAIWQITFSPDGKKLASANFDNAVWIWDSANGEVLHKLEHDSDVYSVSFHPNNTILASAGADATVRLWDFARGEAIQIMRGFRAEIQNVIFSSDGEKLILLLSNGEVSVWQLDEQGLPEEKPVLEWKMRLQTHNTGYHPIQNIEHVSLTPDGRRLVTLNWGENGDLIFWDLNTGERQYSIIQPTITPFSSRTPNPTEVSKLTKTPTFVPPTTPTLGPTRQSTALALPTLAENAISTKTWDNLVRQHELQKGSLFSAAWAPNGEKIALAGAKGIWFYDAKNWKLSDYLPSENAVISIAFSDDSNLLAYCLDNSFVYVLDLTTNEQIYALEGKWPSSTLKFSQNDSLLLGGHRWGTQIWDLDTGQLLEAEPLTAISSSPNGQYSAYNVGRGNGESTGIKIVNNSNGEIVHVFERSGEASVIKQIVFSPDSQYLAINSQGSHWIRTMALTTVRGTDSIVELWRIEPDHSFTLIQTLEDINLPSEKSISPPSELIFTPDGTQLITLYNELDLKIWDSSTGKLLKQLPVRGKKIYFHPQENKFLILDNGGGIEAWFISQEKNISLLWKLEGFGHYSNTTVSGDLMIRSANHEIKLWDLQDEHFLGAPTQEIKINNPSTVAVISPDRRILARNGEEGSIILQDLKSSKVKNLSGHPVDRYTGGEGAIRLLKFSPDGNLLASAGNDWMIRVWRVSDGEMLAEFMGEIAQLEFSSDGQLLVGSTTEMMSCFDGVCTPTHADIYVWDMQNLDLLRVFDLAGENIALDPNAANLASINSSSGEVLIFSMNTGELLNTWEASENCQGALFTPDGNTLVTIYGKSLKFWEPTSRKLQKEIVFSYRIAQINFTTDGRKLILVYSNGVIETWHINP